MRATDGRERRPAPKPEPPLEGNAQLPARAAGGSPDHRRAMEAAARVLARRPRSERELRERLGRAGVPAEATDSAIARLGELGLVDDEAFARWWVEERGGRKGLGPEAIRSELRTQGVGGGDIVGDALRRGFGSNEGAKAAAVAARLAPKVGGRPLIEQARRIRQMLARRGFSEEAVEDALRSVLPPAGWD